MIYVIEFVNLLIIPILSVSICVKRGIGKKQIGSIIFLYSWMCVLNLVSVFFLMKVMNALVGIAFARYSEYYTVIAFVVAVLLPYITEVIIKCVKVEMIIKGKEQ